LRDPGEDLKKVLAFKRQIEKGKKYLYKRYPASRDFPDLLEAQLAEWQRDHEATASPPSSGGLLTIPPATIAAPRGAAPAAPSFDYWIAEADSLMEAETPNYSGALFCLEKASTAAPSEREWARAKNLIGTAQFYLNNLNESIAAFSAIVERFDLSGDTDTRSWQAVALLNKGITLGQLGRSEEEVAVYDDLLARFGSAPEPSLREPVARALLNKGATLGQLGRSEEEVAVYDDLLARFGSAPELPLRESVAKALVNKGVRLGQLGRGEEAVAVYDDVVARFGSAPEVPLREQVASALVNKGVTLGQLGRSEEAIAVYDDLLARFGSAPEPSLRELVAKAHANKAALKKLRRNKRKKKQRP